MKIYVEQAAHQSLRQCPNIKCLELARHMEIP